jgi:hypothetical protein
MPPKLATVGFKLAVLGVDEPPTAWWHILRPGSFNVPQVGDKGVSHGRSLCGRIVLTNGYASDFTPDTDLCPACREQL